MRDRLDLLARNQHGVASHRQLLDLGLGRGAIHHRVATGNLHRVHHGVYAIGRSDLSDHGRSMAAVLAVGGESVLSHGSAAGLWSLIPPPSGFVDVSFAGRAGRRGRPGIRIHRPRDLPGRDTTRRLNIPVTTPTRTLLDLRRIATCDELARARRQAEFLGLPLDLERLDDRDPTRSELERRFLALCRHHRLPLPEVNAVVAGYEVDFLWRDQRLVVETDGWEAHRGREAFEADRRRDLALADAGLYLLRLGWRQVTAEPNAVAAIVRKRLVAA